MNKQKIILPISILLGCFILGAFYFLAQTKKLESVETQQRLDSQLKQSQQDYAARVEDNKSFALKECLTLAETNYGNGMNYNYLGSIEVPIGSPRHVALANMLKNDQDTCFKQYK